MHRPRNLFVLIALLFVTACANERPLPDAGAAFVPEPLAFETCKNGKVECAELKVPLDWGDPTGPTLTLPVVRGRALGPAEERRGVLLFNFGGPGAPTLEPIAAGFPRTPFPDPAQAVARRFDFVAIDWRGVGTSQPALDCLSPELKKRLDTFTLIDDDAGWAEAAALGEAFRAGCREAASAELLGHLGTESAARDMEALRLALGEEQINYFAGSYGTRLGAMYATLFPDRVRAMVLDSPVTPSTDLAVFFSSLSAATENALGRFFRWCATTTAQTCAFRSAGADATAIAARFDALLAKITAAPIVSGGVPLNRGTLIGATIGNLYAPNIQWPGLARALASLDADDARAMLGLVKVQLSLLGEGGNAPSANRAIRDEDFGLPTALATPADVRAFAKGTLATASSHFGLQVGVELLVAQGWPAAETVARQKRIGRTTAPPVLVTATRHDTVCPHAWAEELVAALANGSHLVTYEGDGHSSAGIQVCLASQIISFLMDPTEAPEQPACTEVPF